MHEIYLLALLNHRSVDPFGSSSSVDQARDEQAFYDRHAPRGRGKPALMGFAPISKAIVAGVAVIALSALFHH